jgi:hypothetical protein
MCLYIHILSELPGMPRSQLLLVTIPKRVELKRYKGMHVQFYFRHKVCFSVFFKIIRKVPLESEKQSKGSKKPQVQKPYLPYLKSKNFTVF